MQISYIIWKDKHNTDTYNTQRINICNSLLGLLDGIRTVNLNVLIFWKLLK